MKTNHDTEIEHRTYPVSELRVEDGDKPKLRGYAAVFNVLSEELFGFREKIAPGAFKKSIKGDVRAFVNHDSSHIIGRTKSGTLRLKEDATGLLIEIDPPNTSPGRDIVESIRRGDITQMSFGFRTRKEHWETENGENIRTLLDLDLLEVSPVVFPAYPDTSVAVRSLESWKDEQGVEHSQSDQVDCKSRRLRLQLAEVE